MAIKVPLVAVCRCVDLSSPISSLKKGQVISVVSVCRKLIIVISNSASAVSSVAIQFLMTRVAVPWIFPPRYAMPLRSVLRVFRIVCSMSISSIRIFMHNILREFMLSLIFFLSVDMVASFMG